MSEFDPRVGIWIVQPDPRLKIIDIQPALSERRINVTVTGDGLERIQLTIVARRGEQLRVGVPIGTVFAPQSDLVQNMVCTQTQYATLPEDGRQCVLNVPVACINMHRKTPSSHDVFSISSKTDSTDLQKLLTNNEFERAGPITKRYAIWTITDNPTRDRNQAIGNVFTSEPIDDRLFGRIKRIFHAAGILPFRYKAFGGSSGAQH